MPDLPERSHCRHPDCGAPILWVRTVRGRLMPLDAEPVPFGKGVMVFAENNVVRGGTQDDAGPYFMSHHATCEYADEFRKGRKG